jgi:hypothetical protein
MVPFKCVEIAEATTDLKGDTLCAGERLLAPEEGEGAHLLAGHHQHVPRPLLRAHHFYLKQQFFNTVKKCTLLPTPPLFPVLGSLDLIRTYIADN